MLQVDAARNNIKQMSILLLVFMCVTDIMLG